VCVGVRAQGDKQAEMYDGGERETEREGGREEETEVARARCSDAPRTIRRGPVTGVNGTHDCSFG
jgi:hypothetical protein